MRSGLSDGLAGSDGSALLASVTFMLLASVSGSGAALYAVISNTSCGPIVHFGVPGATLLEAARFSSAGAAAETGAGRGSKGCGAGCFTFRLEPSHQLPQQCIWQPTTRQITDKDYTAGFQQNDRTHSQQIGCLVPISGSFTTPLVRWHAAGSCEQHGDSAAAIYIRKCSTVSPDSSSALS